MSLHTTEPSGYSRPTVPTECNWPGMQPQQGGTIEDISSGFPLWSLLFSSPLITCTTGGLLCGITHTNGATRFFCCRKSDSHTVTAKTVIKNPKLHHDVVSFQQTEGGGKRGGLVLHMKQMGLLTSYGMCRLVLWSRYCVYWISMEK